MLQQTLLTGIFVSGLFYLIFHYRKKTVLTFVFKPLTTLLIILLAVLSEPEVSVSYRYLIVAGLVFSLAGDVFLVLPTDRFIAGLVSFFVAHLFFIAAFAGDFGPYFGWGYLIPVLVYMAIVLKVLLPHTKTMTIPVLAYVLVLMVFMWQASGRGWTLAGNSPGLAFFGAALFVISDTILAYNRFVKQLKFERFFTMLTYWLAQLLLALSV
ncbi:MAG: lysoplasmalogenase [Bacteroidales bacterium]|nr:lysoplasmalogenase [Bacteroidales bacterium]